MNIKHDFEPGDVVSVRFGGVLRHYGVVVMGGQIVSNSGSAGGVISQSLAEFAKGRRVTKHRGGDADGYLADARARAMIGRDYHLTGSNCIDFTRNARRQRKTPWAVGRAVLMAIGDMRRG